MATSELMSESESGGAIERGHAQTKDIGVVLLGVHGGIPSLFLFFFFSISFLFSFCDSEVGLPGFDGLLGLCEVSYPAIRDR